MQEISSENLPKKYQKNTIIEELENLGVQIIKPLDS